MGLFLEFWPLWLPVSAFLVIGWFTAGRHRAEAFRQGKWPLCYGGAAALLVVGVMATDPSPTLRAVAFLLTFTGLAAIIHGVIVAKGARLLALGLGLLAITVTMIATFVVSFRL